MLFDEVIKYVQQGNINFWNVKKPAVAMQEGITVDSL